MTDPNPDELDVDMQTALDALQAEDQDVQSDEDQGVEDEGDEETEDESVEDESEEVEDSSEEVEEDAGQAKRTIYFDHDLTDVPEEVREKLISDLKNKDKYTNRVSQENSTLSKKVEELEALIRSQFEDEGESAPEIEMPSDDDIVTQLGLDPEDPFFEIKRDAALPTARLVIQQQLETQAAKQAEETASQELQEYANTYMSTLDTLEGEHGELPIEREEFLEWAAQNDLHDPTEAYNTFVTMAKGIIDEGLEGAKPQPKSDPKRDEAKRLAKKKASVGSRRASGSTVPAAGEDLDSIIRKAMAEVGFEE